MKQKMVGICNNLLRTILVLIFILNGISLRASPNKAVFIGISLYGAIYSLNEEDGTAKVVGKKEGFDNYYILENIYKDGKTYAVTEITAGAFKGCYSVNSISIPNSITKIGSEAFSGCINLTSISIPSSITEIAPSTFEGCSSLTTVTIPYSITSIGASAFKGCSNLATVTIPSSITEIASSTFEGCSGLTSISIPNTITKISSSAFNGCSGLATITIPNSVTKIDYFAFYGCSGLTSVIIPSSVSEIDNTAFWGCKGLIKSIYPSTLKNPFDDGVIVEYDPNNTIIEEDVFYDSEKKTLLFVPLDFQGDFTIPSTVNSFGKSFYGCRGLTSVSIPNSISEIESSAFEGCSGLTEIQIEDGPDTLEFGKDVFKGVRMRSLYLGRNYTNPSYSLPFAYQTALQNLTIGNSVSEIGSYAFYGCNDLTSLSIPNSVTEIGSYAFYGCYDLTSLSIPNSVTKIGSYAFYGCYDMTEIRIEDGADPLEFGEESFGVDVLQKSRITSLYLGRNITGLTFTTLTDLTIGNSVTEIGSSAFSGCSGLTSVTIPNSVTEIGWSAFYCCTGLTSVKIGNSVTKIGSKAFSGCSRLTSITIPDSVNEIGVSAFEGCKGMTSVTIGESVTEIGEDAFYACYGLRTTEFRSIEALCRIKFENIYSNPLSLNGPTLVINGEEIKDIVIPNSVPEIGAYAFFNCTNLNEIQIEDGTDPLVFGTDVFKNVNINSLYVGRNFSCTADSPDHFPFANHKSLATLTIGSNVTEISEYAFYNCDGLKGDLIVGNSVTNIKAYAFGGTYFNSIYLPKSLKQIDYKAFVTEDPAYCPEKIVCETPTPPRVTSDIIFSSYYSPLYVLPTSVNEYKNAPIWKNFYYILEIEPAAIEKIVLDRESMELNVGETFTLIATINPEEASNQSVEWRSDNPLVAEVSEDGTVSALSVGVATISASCGDVSASCKVTVNPILATDITLNVEEMTLCAGESEQLIASIMPENVTDKTIIWRSDDPQIAEVAEDGTVSAISVGTTTIYASCGDALATCEVIVDPVLASDITISEEHISLEEGVEFQLSATIVPENTTDKTIVWSSSDESIATVSENGLVKGISQGETIIYAKCGDVSTSCNVSVSNTSFIDKILSEGGESITIVSPNGILRNISNAKEIRNLTPGEIHIIGKKKILIK